MDHVTHPFSFADFNIFLPEISKKSDIDSIQIHNI